MISVETVSGCSALDRFKLPYSPLSIWIPHTASQVQYSRVGLTSAWYAFVFIGVCLVRTFIFTKPRVLLALALMLGLKKIIIGFRLPTDPCRCLRLSKFYACQKYKIKYCRPSAVEQLGYSKNFCNLFTRKRVRLSAAANSVIAMCCLFACSG